MIWEYFSDTTLRYVLMVGLTLLCLSIYRIIKSKGNYIQKSRDLRSKWVRNKHVRSVKEAEHFFNEALDNLSPSITFNC